MRESTRFESHPQVDRTDRRGEGKSRSMIQAIGDTLPIITAVMISPIPVAGLIVVLTSKKGPVKSVAYGMGFFAALWLPTFLLAWTGTKTIAVSGSSGASSTWSIVIHGGMGVILLVVGIVAFIKHLRQTLPATEPRWMKTLDSASMLMVFALGGVIVLNPKNVPLLVSAAVDYAQASLSTVQLAIVVTAFAAIGSLLIFLPIVLVHLAPKSSAKLFGMLRPWLIAHNAIVLAVICLIAAAAMLGRAISASF
jgi:Sap, sulfolipid-1-addressing protein